MAFNAPTTIGGATELENKYGLERWLNKAIIESGNSHSNTLTTGDSAHVRADSEHNIKNSCDNELVGFLVVTYQ